MLICLYTKVTLSWKNLTTIRNVCMYVCWSITLQYLNGVRRNFAQEKTDQIRTIILFLEWDSTFSNVYFWISCRQKLILNKTFFNYYCIFSDLLSDFEQLHIDFDSYKTQLIKQQERCGRYSNWTQRINSYLSLFNMFGTPEWYKAFNTIVLRSPKGSVQ